MSGPGGAGCLLLGGVSVPGGSAPGGCLLRGVGVVSQHALRQTPLVNRMTDRCKNITLATTSLRPVIIESNTKKFGYGERPHVRSKFTILLR